MSLSERKIESSTLIDMVSEGFESKIFKTNAIEFINIFKNVIPESKYLESEAEVSAVGVSKKNPELYGVKMQPEEIRAFAGLYCFKQVINGSEEDYQHFIACQQEMKKPILSKEAFNNINLYYRKTFKTSEEIAALLWAILCNDLGKTHYLINLFKTLIDSSKLISHELILAELLKIKPEIFPAFHTLPAKQQQQIISMFSNKFEFSEFEQLTLPVSTLNDAKTYDEPTLNLCIGHTLGDVMGAAANINAKGSLTMHRETWMLFEEAIHSLNNLNKKSVIDVYNQYLTFRGRCINIMPNSPENVALIKLAGSARYAAPEQGEILKAAWNKLSSESKSTLISELNVSGIEGTRPIFVGYGIGLLLNPMGALQKELTQKSEKTGIKITPEERKNANIEGLVIGLTVMAKAYALTRQAMKKDDHSSQVFVAECDFIARQLNNNPRQLMSERWSGKMTDKNRRIDFTILPNKTCTTKKVVLYSAAGLGLFVAVRALTATSGIKPKL